MTEKNSVSKTDKEVVFIMGEIGHGKSTTLNALGATFKAGD